MAELMLVNPRRRHRRRATTHHRRRHVRRRNPETRAERSMAARRGWRGRRRNPSVRERAHEYGRRVRRYRSSHPRSKGVMDTLMHGAIGAAGGITLDILMAKIPLPATMKTGMAHSAVKVVGAVGIGLLGQKFIKNPATANALAVGTMSSVLHDMFRDMLAPHIAMADIGYYNPGMIVGDESGEMQGIGEMGMYVEGMESGMGEYVDAVRL